jgi:AcrR family transcriptional regulator
VGIAERREREKEALRTRIVEAARDIISEEGLDTLSMRAIAERIEYSPATIYLYFKDKNELLGEVVHAGFELLGEFIQAEVQPLGMDASPAAHHRALGRAYARFALENTAYFRVMFELPTVPQVVCAGQAELEDPIASPESRNLLVTTIQKAMDAGLYQITDARVGAMIAWGMIHGITSLYLTGHLAQGVNTQEEFLALVEAAMDTLGSGWAPRETPLPLMT